MPISPLMLAAACSSGSHGISISSSNDDALIQFLMPSLPTSPAQQASIEEEDFDLIQEKVSQSFIKRLSSLRSAELHTFFNSKKFELAPHVVDYLQEQITLTQRKQ